MSRHFDERLVKFLRQYHASPPPPKANVEEALMAQIETQPQSAKAVKHHQQWVFGGIIAASVLLLFTSVRFWQPTPLSSDEAALETFLAENWQAVTTADSSETSWQTLTPEPPESSHRR